VSVRYKTQDKNKADERNDPNSWKYSLGADLNYLLDLCDTLDQLETTKPEMLENNDIGACASNVIRRVVERVAEFEELEVDES
jgi:hypothetical protein